MRGEDEAGDEPTGKVAEEPLGERVVQTLRTVFDPEIPVNVYDLGLIYGLEADEGGRVQIRMTLTSPSCPAAQSLPEEVRAKVSALSGVKEVVLELTWDPPWSMERMSDEAKLQLGLV